VLIAAQEDGRRIGRIRLQRVSDASGASLISAVEMCVEPSSLVRTDGWTGYSSLASHNYVHRVIRKNADVGDNLLPLANRVASLLKRWLTGTHQGAVRLPTSITTWTNTPSDSTAGRPNRGESYSIGWFNRRLR